MPGPGRIGGGRMPGAARIGPVGAAGAITRAMIRGSSIRIGLCEGKRGEQQRKTCGHDKKAVLHYSILQILISNFSQDSRRMARYSARPSANGQPRG